jgi:rhamnosyltransferase
VAEAQVYHSHRYTLSQEFCRYFDTGYARKTYADLLACPAKDDARGSSYVRAMTQYLIQQKPHFLPYAFVHTLTKWLGYKVGQSSIHAPTWFKKTFSSQKYYWK